VLDAKRIARQYWWAWIETYSVLCSTRPIGCIARQYWWAWIETRCRTGPGFADVASPASIGGRGLKQWRQHFRSQGFVHRPPVLVGVD